MHAKLPQLCLTLCNRMNCSRPGSSVHGIFQARLLEWVAMPFSRGSFQPWDQTCISYVSCISRCVLYHQHHLGSPFQRRVDFNFNKVQLTSYVFMDFPFGILPKKSPPNPRSSCNATGPHVAFLGQNSSPYQVVCLSLVCEKIQPKYEFNKRNEGKKKEAKEKQSDYKVILIQPLNKVKDF